MEPKFILEIRCGGVMPLPHVDAKMTMPDRALLVFFPGWIYEDGAGKTTQSARVSFHGIEKQRTMFVAGCRSLSNHSSFCLSVYSRQARRE